VARSQLHWLQEAREGKKTIGIKLQCHVEQMAFQERSKRDVGYSIMVEAC
jgi:hypothetical protein